MLHGPLHKCERPRSRVLVEWLVLPHPRNPTLVVWSPCLRPSLASSCLGRSAPYLPVLVTVLPSTVSALHPDPNEVSFPPSLS